MVARFRAKDLLLCGSGLTIDGGRAVFSLHIIDGYARDLIAGDGLGEG